MIFTLLLIGSLLMPSAHAQDTQGKTLYQYVHKLVQQSEGVVPIELPTERFAAGIYYDNPVKNTEKEIMEEDVDNAVANLIPQLCGGEDLDVELCRSILTKLDATVGTTSWLRQLGRDLQMIATGYESGITDYPGPGVKIVPRLPSITRIWRSSNETFVTPILETSAAGLPYPPENMDTIEDEIETLFDEMLREDLVRWKGDKWDDSEMVAAVWRYNNGVRYVEATEGNCTNTTDETTELILLKKRWCDVEDQLHVIHDLIIQPYINSGEPLPQDDFLIFPSWTDEFANIVIWVRGDDIGLRWHFAIEPVLPLLYTEEYADCIENGQTPKECHEDNPESLIRGGTYPEVVPEPEEGMGICSHPFSKKGYLCRPIEDDECAADPIESTAQGIVLTGCAPEQFKGDTIISPSGPDMCEIGGWRSNGTAVQDNVVDTPEKQSGENPSGQEIRPNQCASCAVDFYCADTCVLGGTATSNFAVTEDRDANGVIRLCMPNALGPKGMLGYLAIHELVHVQQTCNLNADAKKVTFGNGTDETSRVKCCASEREAYFAHCKAMAQDGILERAGVTIDLCASAGANNSCSGFSTGGSNACTDDSIDTQAMWDKVIAVIEDGVTEGWLDVPLTCEDAINQLDKRAQAQVASLPLACTPGCIAEYENTIGNNICYAGQCLEQSLEWHRIIPGRMPLTSGDEAFPWDSCPVADPQYGKFFSPPVLTAPHFPTYNPQRLYDELDRALCQINGLPASSPPVLCAFDSRRRLNLPVAEFMGMSQSLLEQSDEVRVPAAGLLNASSGVGTRKANEFFFRYMERSMRSFGEILQITKTIMEDISTTKFPSVMCPRNADESICSQFN